MKNRDFWMFLNYFIDVVWTLSTVVIFYPNKKQITVT